MGYLLNKLLTDNLWDKEVCLSRDELLVKEGDLDDAIFWVEEGSLRIFTVQDDEEHTIRFGYQNNLITALDTYIRSVPTQFYIQALKKTKVRVVSKSVFVNWVNQDEALKLGWVNLMEELVMQQMEREIDLLISSPAERYFRVLERSPQLFQEIPNKYIASYLRMTPETLSRIKKS